METYLTVEELAAYFKLTEQTIRRWVCKREVPFHKVKNAVHFRLSEIEKWVEANDLLKQAGGEKGREAGLFGEGKAGGEA